MEMLVAKAIISGEVAQRDDVGMRRVLFELLDFCNKVPHGRNILFHSSGG